MRLSACFLSCLLSRPQTATALQRNTRPSTHDAPLPVYGQETVRPVTLSHYRAGKVSFFCLTPVENYNITMRQCTRTFGAWTSYFSCPKKDKSQFPFFCLPGNYYCRIFAFLWTQTREEGFISWSKENFFLRDNRWKSWAGKMWPSCPLE